VYRGKVPTEIWVSAVSLPLLWTDKSHESGCADGENIWYRKPMLELQMWQEAAVNKIQSSTRSAFRSQQPARWA
jgi:hypothetical protein